MYIGDHKWNARQLGVLQVQDKLDAYAKRYYVHKAPRKLIWQPALGQVTLSLQLGPEKRDFSVSPTQASILLFFQV